MVIVRARARASTMYGVVDEVGVGVRIWIGVKGRDRSRVELGYA
jgi:hypothetical protein